MRNRLIGLLTLIVALAAGLVLSSVVFAQTIGISVPKYATPAGPAPKRDLSGVWASFNPPGAPPGYAGVDGQESPGGDIPPMTPWGQAKYDAEKPGYGRRAQAGGNDPMLQCDPTGIPRILFYPTPTEFAQIPGRVLQFFEHDHLWREIWTDGRAIPKDVDPSWNGYSIGKWVDDNTFVVETEGLDDRTWLGATGYPHSDSMHVEERYHRTDQNTIEFSITMTDPVAYTRPWVGAPKVWRLLPKTELQQFFCVWSEENSFTDKIRLPAAAGETK